MGNLLIGFSLQSHAATAQARSQAAATQMNEQTSAAMLANPENASQVAATLAVDWHPLIRVASDGKIELFA
jgi:hypothetical protein